MKGEKAMKKYYSMQRPVAPGTYPKKGAVEIVNYENKRYVMKDHVIAWGYIVYDRELTEKELYDYELTAAVD